MNQTTPIYILGIESSCDDTSAAVLKDGVLLSNVTASQAVHEAYGGVVPELASRAHQQNVVPVVDQAIKRAGITKEMISAIAFTRGPGLMGSLLVGVSFAKGFARSLGMPLIDVNHLQGHVMAHFIKESDDDNSQPPYPFLCLLVSGGNSQIVKVNAYNDMEVLGQTIDDAAGEALKARGILYAPDFIINGGGVINAGQEAFTTYDKENVLKQVHNIYNTVYRMLEESKATGIPEGVIATEFAENRIRNGLDA